jgi:hypothetical protein
MGRGGPCLLREPPKTLFMTRGQNPKIKNAPEPNHLVHTEYRTGWSL